MATKTLTMTVEAVFQDMRDRGMECSVRIQVGEQSYGMARRAPTADEAFSAAVGFAMDRLDVAKALGY